MINLIEKYCQKLNKMLKKDYAVKPKYSVNDIVTDSFHPSTAYTVVAFDINTQKYTVQDVFYPDTLRTFSEKELMLLIKNLTK